MNNILIDTYWNIGKSIIEFEQKGNNQAEYGKGLLKNLSLELKASGKGFSVSNLQHMRLLYLYFPKIVDASTKLTWSHFIELSRVEDDLSRSFYEKQCIKENWSVRELKRQKDSMLFERIALSKDKQGVLDMSKNG